MKLIDKQIYRGPQPQSDKDWQELKSLGITETLDLETQGIGVFGENIDAAQAIAKSYGIITVNMPMGQICPPSKKDLNAAADLLHNYAGPIYVHCKSGVDRTGMVCATYKMKYLGWSKALAVKEMKLMGMHFWYWWWTWSL